MADASALAAALPIAPGQVLGERYVVGEVLGGGGMGVVCAGKHLVLGTPVAIKLIHSDLKNDAEAVQRFMNEARATAALKGEHIARVFDVGQLATGEPYLVMEQLEGVALDQYLLDRGSLPQTEAVDIVLQACEGLAEAHAAGLVHRDIKPPNLFLAQLVSGQYSLKILDFGIAKQRLDQDTPGLTNPGTSLGSPWYMSPEQMLTPASVDERADVWSLGVLLFELLTGKHPFDGETVPQVCAMVLTAIAPRASEQRPGVPPELDQIILRCLEKEPERRFASVSTLAKALIPFASAPTHARGIPLEPDRPTPDDGSIAPVAGSEWAPPPLFPARYLALLALPILALGGWFAFHEGGALSRAVGAACRELPWDPRLLPSASDPELARHSQAPALLQRLHLARATRERGRERERGPERGRAATADEVEEYLAAQRMAEAARQEDWLRSQLKQIREATLPPTSSEPPSTPPTSERLPEPPRQSPSPSDLLPPDAVAPNSH